MKIILVVFFTLIQTVFAQIVFLDVNNNPLEKKAAISAAKKAGKSIIVYPEDDAVFDKNTAFEILAKNPPQTLFISGHDGGGSFGGNRNERFDKQDLENFSDKNPEFKKNLRVLGLLGCNTANHYQVKKWKKSFPEIAFIAGYDGSAPLGTRPAGHNYIEDIILKTDAILAETDSNKLKDIFQGFNNINSLTATLFIDTNYCEEPTDGKYIFRPQRKADEKFVPFTSKECEEKEKIFETNYASSYDQYFNGDVEIPRNISQGNLKEIYTFVRQNEHCFRDDSGESDIPTGDHLLFLLFYHNVFENFNKHYEKEIDDFFNEIKIIDDPDFAKIFDKEMNRKKEDLKRLQSYVEDYSAFEKDLIAQIGLREKRLEEKLGPEYLKLKNEYLNGAIEYVKLKALPGWEEFEKEYSLIFRMKEDLKLGKKSHPYEDLEDNIAYLKLEIERMDFTQIKKDYQSLPAKNISDFKKLSRLQVRDFIHKVSSLPLELCNHPSFCNEMKYLYDDVLYRLDDETIPFNWHDSQLGDPVPLKENNYHKDNLNALKQETSDGLMKYFD